MIHTYLVEPFDSLFFLLCFFSHSISLFDSLNRQQSINPQQIISPHLHSPFPSPLSLNHTHNSFQTNTPLLNIKNIFHALSNVRRPHRIHRSAIRSYASFAPFFPTFRAPNSPLKPLQILLERPALQPLLQRQAAGVALIPTPGQLLRPVAGKAACRLSVHTAPPSLIFSHCSISRRASQWPSNICL